MREPVDAIGDALARALDDPAARWSLGGFGAGAEFGRAPGEAVTALGRFGRLTLRGALLLAPSDDLVPVAYETGFAGGWSQTVALCLPAATDFARRPGVVTALGCDGGAARPADRTAWLFDLGLGLPHGWFGLRTHDPRLAAGLSAAGGTPAFGGAGPVPDLLAARAVDVVVATGLGRIEVFADPVPPGTGGPRSYASVRVLRAGRTHAATAPIPPGLVPCAHLHPAHPCHDAARGPIPFDADRYAAFQALLVRWGDPDRLALKARLEAGETLPRSAGRADRAVARVVAAQGSVRPGKMVHASSRDVGKSSRDTTP